MHGEGFSVRFSAEMPSPRAGPAIGPHDLPGRISKRTITTYHEGPVADLLLCIFTPFEMAKSLSSQPSAGITSGGQPAVTRLQSRLESGSGTANEKGGELNEDGIIGYPDAIDAKGGQEAYLPVDTIPPPTETPVPRLSRARVVLLAVTMLLTFFLGVSTPD